MRKKFLTIVAVSVFAFGMIACGTEQTETPALSTAEAPKITANATAIPEESDSTVPENLDSESGIEGNLRYEITGSSVTITGIEDNSVTELYIPGKIANRLVVRINENAFEGCSNLKKVELAEGIMFIDSYAFKDCKALEVIIFGSLGVIDETAFEGCEFANITAVYPSGVSSAIEILRELGFKKMENVIYYQTFTSNQENQENTTDNNEPTVNVNVNANVDVSADLDKLEFAVNGVKLNLQCDEKELANASKSGRVIYDWYENEYIDVESAVLEYSLSEREVVYHLPESTDPATECVFTARVVNYTDGELLIPEATVVEVFQSQDIIYENYEFCLVYFPGNLYVGKKISVDEIIEIFGEPTESTSEDRAEYLWEKLIYDTDKSYFIIYLHDGVIHTIEYSGYKKAY